MALDWIQVVKHWSAIVNHGKDLLVNLYLNWTETINRRSAKVDHGLRLDGRGKMQISPSRPWQGFAHHSLLKLDKRGETRISPCRPWQGFTYHSTLKLDNNFKTQISPSRLWQESAYLYLLKALLPTVRYSGRCKTIKFNSLLPALMGWILHVRAVNSSGFVAHVFQRSPRCSYNWICLPFST